MELRILTLDENKQDKIFEAPECQQLLEIYAQYYPKIEFHLPWVAYFIIKEHKIVGSCSFTGQPQNGVVEIAYWTFKKFEGQGIAKFACKELVAIAKKENPNIIITAKTAPEKNASTRILDSNGFMYSKVVQDDEIGDAWLWVLE